MGLMSLLPIPDFVQGAYVGAASKMHPFVSPKVGNSGLIDAAESESGDMNLSKVDLRVVEHSGIHWVPLSKQVIFHCPGKKLVIQGAMASSLKTEAQSNWEELFGNSGGIMGGAANILDTFSNISSMTTGRTLRQPWMSRKNWKGTNPLKFSVDVNFTNPSFVQQEQTSGVDEKTGATKDTTDYLISATYAYRMMCNLLALVYPKREVLSGGNNEGKVEYNYDIPDVDFSTFSGTVMAVAGTGMAIAENIIKSFGTRYTIPGPSIASAEENKKQVPYGNPVIVYLGNYGTFKSCYIERVSVETSKSTNLLGYPNFVKATVDFTKADMSWTDENGMLILDADEDDNVGSAVVTQVKKAVTAWADALAEGAKNVANAVKGNT